MPESLYFTSEGPTYVKNTDYRPLVAPTSGGSRPHIKSQLKLNPRIIHYAKERLQHSLSQFTQIKTIVFCREVSGLIVYHPLDHTLHKHFTRHLRPFTFHVVKSAFSHIVIRSFLTSAQCSLCPISQSLT